MTAFWISKELSTNLPVWRKSLSSGKNIGQSPSLKKIRPIFEKNKIENAQYDSKKVVNIKLKSQN